MIQGRYQVVTPPPFTVGGEVNRLNVYNLFDREYIASINKSGYRYTPGAPRSAMLALNWQF